ncbi:MAG: type II secretion system protein [Thermoguttaceae bacterium]
MPTLRQGKPPGRRGFTLIELLVVIVILAILAGIVLAGMRGAQQAAREARTKATIAKLHTIVMELYESYRTRRVPLSEAEMQQIAQMRLGWNPVTRWTLAWVARVRLAALRDLMRMEMPERWTDVQNGPRYLPSPPALFGAYRARCYSGPRFLPSYDNGPAECLYLLVSIAAGADARAQFAQDEIGDTDGDGFPEFLDAWGRPIFFLRWAPGFDQSDLQWNVFTPEDRQRAAAEDHDPFDARKVDPSAWRLVPLIYSAGRDGEYGVAVDDVSAPYVWSNDTYTRENLMGMPTAETCFDNIHNHRIEAQ